MIENQVERHLHSRIGLIGGLCFKFTSPGTAGVPDRIIIHERNIAFDLNFIVPFALCR